VHVVPGEIPVFHQRFSYGSCGICTRFSIEENAGKNTSGEATNKGIAQDKGNHLQHDGIPGEVRSKVLKLFIVYTWR
jgi:hypothetical protein